MELYHGLIRSIERILLFKQLQKLLQQIDDAIGTWCSHREEYTDQLRNSSARLLAPSISTYR